MPFLVPQGDDFWSAVPSPGFPSARVNECPRVSPVKDCKGDEGTGASVI